MTEVVKAREDTSRKSGGQQKSDDRFFVLDVAGGNGDLSWLLNNVTEAFGMEEGEPGVRPNNVDEPMSTSSSTPASGDLGSAEKSSMKKGLFSSSSTSTSPVSRSIPIHSTVVDPRGKTINCHHIIKSVRYLQKNPEERKRRAIPGLPTHQPLALLIEEGKIRHCLGDACNSADSDGDIYRSNNKNENDGGRGGGTESSRFVTPEQIPIPLNNELVNIIQNLQIIKERRGGIREKKQTEFHRDPLAFITMDELKKWRNFFQNQQKQIRKIDGSNNDNKRKRSSGDDDDDSRVINNTDVSPSTKSSTVAIDDDADTALELILKTDLICGFHPDQATDSCFDLGDVLGVPVAGMVMFVCFLLWSSLFFFAHLSLSLSPLPSPQFFSYETTTTTKNIFFFLFSCCSILSGAMLCFSV